MSIRKAKSHQGRKILDDREPKMIENEKKTVILKGTKTSQVVSDFAKDIVNFHLNLVFPQEKSYI